MRNERVGRHSIKCVDENHKSRRRCHVCAKNGEEKCLLFECKECNVGLCNLICSETLNT